MGTAGEPTGDVIPSALGFTAAISAMSSAGCTLEGFVNELLWWMSFFPSAFLNAIFFFFSVREVKENCIIYLLIIS